MSWESQRAGKIAGTEGSGLIASPGYCLAKGTAHTSTPPQVSTPELDADLPGAHTVHVLIVFTKPISILPTLSLSPQVSMAELDAERAAEEERLERQQQEKMQRRRELQGAVLQVCERVWGFCRGVWGEGR